MMKLVNRREPTKWSNKFFTNQNTATNRFYGCVDHIRYSTM
jgi:hypothetical protein